MVAKKNTSRSGCGYSRSCRIVSVSVVMGLPCSKTSRIAKYTGKSKGVSRPVSIPRCTDSARKERSDCRIGTEDLPDRRQIGIDAMQLLMKIPPEGSPNIRKGVDSQPIQSADSIHQIAFFVSGTVTLRDFPGLSQAFRR